MLVLTDIGKATVLTFRNLLTKIILNMYVQIILGLVKFVRKKRTSPWP